MKSIYTIVKHLIIVCFMAGAMNTSLSQQIPGFNQYQYSPEFYNPAALGDGFIGIQYRSQFSELESDLAPTTFAVMADLSSVLKLSEKKIAIGLSLISDKEHLIERLKGKFSFAYHLIQNDNNRFSAGIDAGLNSQSLNLSGTRISDPLDAVIYDGSSKKAVFDGGFGLCYQYNSNTGQVFNFNLATPQLFTSDISYDEGREYDTSPHLLAGISYRFPVGPIALEPHLMYRDIIGEKSIKEGKIDLSLRAHFLDDKLWLAGGTRLGAMSYQLSFGVKVVDNLSLQGSFETHSMLGSSWEAQVVYTFESSGYIDDPLFGNLENQVKVSAVQVDDLSKATRSNLQIAQGFLKEAKRPGISKENRIAKLNRINNPLRLAKENIEKILDPAQTALNVKVEAGDYYKKARLEEKSNRNMEKAWDNIQSKADDVENKVLNLSREYAKLTTEIQALKETHNLEPLAFETMVATKDVAKLQTYYQNALDKAVGIPDDMGPVSVTTDGITLKLKYQYPNSRQDYNLEDGFNGSRLIADHIIVQIKDLNAKNKSIESITVMSKMQSRKSSLEGNTLATTYKSEQFGPRINVIYDFYDEANKSIKSENTLIVPGPLNQIQLTCLKMFGLNRYFVKNGISSTISPVKFEMSAPNYDQSTPEMYNIIIEFKE